MDIRLIESSTLDNTSVYLITLSSIEDFKEKLPSSSLKSLFLVLWDATEVSVDEASSFLEKLVLLKPIYCCFHGKDSSRMHEILEEIEAYQSLSETESKDNAILSTDHENEDLKEVFYFISQEAVPTSTEIENVYIIAISQPSGLINKIQRDFLN